jgi:hypothetical protein
MKLNLDGDRQADLTVHVGVDKANKLIQYAPMNVTIAIFEWSEKHHILADDKKKILIGSLLS